MATLQETQATQTTSAAPQPDEAVRPHLRRHFSLRGFTSLLLSFSFLAMCVSGAMLFLTPRGRTANWTDWSLVGLDKHQWGSVHVNNSMVFVVIAVLHLVLNWSVFTRYIKKKAATGLHMKKELAWATALAAICVAGPIWSVPPFSTTMALNEDIKDYWDQNAQQPPVPHAEELTLAELASTIKLSFTGRVQRHIRCQRRAQPGQQPVYCIRNEQNEVDQRERVSVSRVHEADRVLF